MNEIIDFLNPLFELEQKTLYARYKKSKFEEYNTLAAELKSHTYDITVGFGLPVMRVPKPDDFYEGFENEPYPNKRWIYKISQYENEKYGTVWACYVSEANPFKDGTLTSCLIVGKMEGKLKVLAKFNPDYDTTKWSSRGGDHDIEYYKLGEPTAIERLKSPSADEAWSIKEFNKNR